MGLVPLFAWTFFFIFFVAILAYNSLRQSKARKIAFESKILGNPFSTGQKVLPNAFTSNWSALKSDNWLNGKSLLALALLTNEEEFNDTDWIELLKTVKSYQLAANTYFHLLKYQPTRFVASILRWK